MCYEGVSKYWIIQQKCFHFPPSNPVKLYASLQSTFSSFSLNSGTWDFIWWCLREKSAAARTSFKMKSFFLQVQESSPRRNWSDGAIYLWGAKLEESCFIQAFHKNISNPLTLSFFLEANSTKSPKLSQVTYPLSGNFILMSGRSLTHHSYLLWAGQFVLTEVMSIFSSGTLQTEWSRESIQITWQKTWRSLKHCSTPNHR